MIHVSPLALAVGLLATQASAHVDVTHMTQPYNNPYGPNHTFYDAEEAMHTEVTIGDPQDIKETAHEPVLVEQTADPVDDEPVVEEDDDDPIEGFNRVIFEINDFFYGLIFTPAAKIYRGIFPEEVRTRVHYVLRNLWEPVNFGNSLLQGDFEEAGTAVGRLVTNSTIGVAGIFDVGEDWGMPYERRDFGMTLASWGVGEGGYFVLPLIGPSTFRDAPGIAVDIAMDPLTWILPHTDVYYLAYVRAGMETLDEYSDVMPGIEDLRETSVDFYASIRAWHLERRRAKVREALGEPIVTSDAPSPDDED